VAVFRDPKVELEQYPTGAHLASRLLYTVRVWMRVCMYVCLQGGIEYILNGIGGDVV
jgi:hypothetical protein